jgi:hypothetical protein
MSTDYFVENPIPVSDLLEFRDVTEGLEKDGLIDYQFILDTVITRKVSGERIDESEPTEFSKLSPNESFSLRITLIDKKKRIKPTCLWVWVEEDQMIRQFTRYGRTNVSPIIYLIKYFCDTTLIYEHEWNHLESVPKVHEGTQ